MSRPNTKSYIRDWFATLAARKKSKSLIKINYVETVVKTFAPFEETFRVVVGGEEKTVKVKAVAGVEGPVPVVVVDGCDVVLRRVRRAEAVRTRARLRLQFDDDDELDLEFGAANVADSFVALLDAYAALSPRCDGLVAPGRRGGSPFYQALEAADCQAYLEGKALKTLLDPIVDEDAFLLAEDESRVGRISLLAFRRTSTSGREAESFVAGRLDYDPSTGVWSGCRSDEGESVVLGRGPELKPVANRLVETVGKRCGVGGRRRARQAAALYSDGSEGPKKGQLRYFLAHEVEDVDVVAAAAAAAAAGKTKKVENRRFAKTLAVDDQPTRVVVERLEDVDLVGGSATTRPILRWSERRHLPASLLRAHGACLLPSRLVLEAAAMNATLPEWSRGRGGGGGGDDGGGVHVAL